MAEREVFFYACQDVDKQPKFDCKAAVEDINDLAEKDWRVPELKSPSKIGVIVDRVGTSNSRPTHLRLVRIRSDSPHRLARAGGKRVLRAAAAGQTRPWSEQTWVVLWPDDHYLAAVSSRDAPGHKRLGYYFYETSGQRTHMVNLFNPDLDKKFRELRKYGLKSVAANIYASKFQEELRASGRRGMSQIRAATKGSDAVTIKIGWSVGRKKATLSDTIGEVAAELADHIDAIESLHIKGLNRRGESVELNMKHERIRGPIEIAGSTDS